MIKDLLRLENEEYVHFNEVQIHDILVLNCIDFMNQLKDFYFKWNKDDSLVLLPKKQIFESKKYSGDFRVMPCIINEDELIKSVKIIGTNEENKVIKDKISVGKSFLIHPYDNYIYAMFDVCALSSFRTAAISVLAYNKSYNHDKLKAGIIGVGRIGFYTTLLLHKWLGINSFFCSDISEKNKDSFTKLVSLYMPNIKINFILSNKMENNCDSVFVATDSKKAIFSIKNSTKLAFISSVGADANNLSEINSDILVGRSLVIDSLHSMMLGDLYKWKEQNIITQTDVLELKNITEPIENKILFISTGIAVQDTFISKYIFDNIS